VAAQGTTLRLPPLVWLFVSFRGRISRGIYWLAYGLLLCINAVLVGQLIGGPEASYARLADALTPFVIIATLYANLAVAAKRLHDMGFNGMFALALFVPIINFVFTIWIGIMPGTDGANRYGDIVDRQPA